MRFSLGCDVPHPFRTGSPNPIPRWPPVCPCCPCVRAALALALLAACGGGESTPLGEELSLPPTASALATASSAVRTPRTASGASASSTGLTVRARGSLLAGVGPTMVVRVNQNVIGTVEVSNTAWADFQFSTPALVAGDKVDVVFTNDAASAMARP